MTAQAKLKSSKLDAALSLRDAGFVVFPLVPNAKTPIIQNWPNLATNDETQIRQWWSQWPDANIGITTAGWLVIDIDPDKGGVQSFERLVVTGDPVDENFPLTIAARTRSGGTHMFYRLPPRTVVSNSAGLLGAGIDVRSYGGLVVGAGSVIDGKVYGWKDGYAPGDRPMAEAPAWLIARCKSPKPKTRAAGERVIEEDETALKLAESYLADKAVTVIEGGRDNAGFAIAAGLFDFGISQDTCLSLMREWNVECCRPPLDTSDIERIVWSAEKNRGNAIGAKHPAAPGFDVTEIAARATPTIQPNARLFYLSLQQGAAKALTHGAEPLIEGVIDCGAMSVVYGESNTGKSFTEMDKDFHIAAGLPWAHHTVKQGAVVWIAAEGGSGVYKRLAALVKHYGRNDVPLYIIPCPVDLRRPDADLKPLIELIKTIERDYKQKILKITIDTLSRVMAGGDENSPVDMGLLVNHFDTLRAGIGAHLAVIHHTGKDKAKGARGHSLLRAATDTEIEVAGRLIKTTKQRDLDRTTELLFRLKPLHVGADLKGRNITSCYVEIRQKGEAPETKEPLTRTEAEMMEDITEALKTSQSTTFGWKFVQDNLRENGDEKTPTKKPTRQTIIGHLSALSEKGHLLKREENQYALYVGNVSESVGMKNV